MDELLYLVALVVGIAGAYSFWRYSRTKKMGLIQTIRKQRRK